MFREDAKSESVLNPKNIFLSSLISGGAAGTSCDMILFPLDTIKTRLQSQHGFLRSGGFKKLYCGFQPVLIGSFPASALFFITYEGFKESMQPFLPPQYHSLIHMVAASLGEVMACLIRVPVEVVKQRRQAMLDDGTKLKLRTLYRGYGSMLLRDLPVGLVHMPLWEYFKLCWQRYVHRDCTPLEGAICGGVSGTISAAITNPLDVAKTRIMLSSTTADSEEVRILHMLREIYAQNGTRGLFAGFSPRVTAFTIGGFVFFGIYEQTKKMCSTVFPYTSRA